ncbi:hypothetical protein WR25_12997 [Diploscapter pachys]|uniref:Uncharacterized protein n=1 Tax=Diploscapter pachys TaxID=2018661 RepID=A0A2A2LKD4_9BILA|nr:hypothetical protein WR25_12997 [Diploscapter pachys]
MSDEFKEAVEMKYIRAWNVGRFHSVYYGQTSVGQRYALVVTSGVWYKIRLILEISKETFDIPESTIFEYDCSSHLTSEGVEGQVERWKDQMNRRDVYMMPK